MPGKEIERNECLIKYGQLEIYNFYKKKIKSLGFGADSVYNVRMGLMSEIQGEFNEHWMQKLIMEKGLIFRLPYGLGRVLCKKYKPKLKLDENGKVMTHAIPVDWKKSKDRWAEMWPGLTPKELKNIPNKPLVYCLNEHSGGYRYVIFWEKKDSRVVNNRVYNFVPNRRNHRHLAKVIKDPEIIVDYYDLKPLSRRYKNRKWKHQRRY